MGIKIIKPGLLSTIQDGGRTGYRNIGIGTGGIMDRFAFTVGNYLVANERDVAAIEFHFPGPEITFITGAVIAITGIGFTAFLDEQPIPLWRTVCAKSGAVLRFGNNGVGAWGYLCVHGGWKATPWLGSSSTHLLSGVGGFHGRSLRKNDEVEWVMNQPSFEETQVLKWLVPQKEIDLVYSFSISARCVAGPEYFLLSDERHRQFIAAPFIVSNNSNRMGYRLIGNPVVIEKKIELVSSPVDFGTIQLLPDGNLIVLMADHQTTGGYPRIAAVIKSDLPKVAQTTPNERIQFSWTTYEEAERSLFEMEKKFAEIKRGCEINFRNYIYGK